MTRRLTPGERLWSGRVVTPALARAYNRASERIESFERSGRAAPDSLINGRHNLIR